MVDFAVIEISIFVVSVPFILYFASSSAMFRAMMASAVVSFTLEIVNEKGFSMQGTYYPKSLFFMPFFKFPVAIILLSVLYAGIINIAAFKVSRLFMNRVVSAISFFVAVLLFNISALYVENAGIYSRYWVHSNADGIPLIQKHIYFFYLLVVLAGSVFVISGSLKKSKRTD